ncbi:MAG: DUF58 domain-containing protein [Chitinispirillaceae bacterium]|nr:DUF58 domain-containing protein [Chitinispirillaceae bacterium]
MKFVITGRGLLLPVIAGIVLLFRHWIPGATALCVALNLLAVLCIAIDYFMIPEPGVFSVTRLYSRQFFLSTAAEIRVRLTYSIPIPLEIQFVDRPPAFFAFEKKRFRERLARGEGTFTLTYSVTPLRRGRHTFNNAGMRLQSPLGLVARQNAVALDDTVHVYPVIPDEKEGLHSRYYFAQTESRLVKTYGPGREFAQMRDYRPGDDRKNIHWRRSARCGKLIVREYEPELGQNIFMMIDGGRLMMAETGGLSKVDWAVASTISLAREALSKKDSIGIMGFSNRVETYLMPSNKKIQLTTLVRTIYAFQPKFIEPDYRNAFQWIRTHVKTRSIIVLYTDFIDPYLSGELAHHIRLLNRQHRVICCAMGFHDLRNVGYRPSDTINDAVLAAVARESIDNRKKILGDLLRAGVDVVDVLPEKLSAAVLNSYIQARWKG